MSRLFFLLRLDVVSRLVIDMQISCDDLFLLLVITNVDVRKGKRSFCKNRKSFFLILGEESSAGVIR